MSTMAGVQGGTLERPALRRRFTDESVGKIRIEVAYMVERGSTQRTFPIFPACSLIGEFSSLLARRNPLFCSVGNSPRNT
jgi:hypothetical protein